MISLVLPFALVMSRLIPAPQGEARLLFAGDAMQHERQLNAARIASGGYDFSASFEGIRPLVQQADYAVVNLETPLGGAPYSGYPMFCAPDAFLDALVNAGFDFFLTANNHALDRHDRGVTRTIGQLAARGLPHTGTFANDSLRRRLTPSIVNVNGFRIAILNYTYGTNGITERNGVVVNRIDPERIAADIAGARHFGAEIVVVCPHWGIEYRTYPSQEQKQLADLFLQYGADMVIGSHPHVIQPMEMRHNPATGRPAVIVYSLGNFISGMRTTDTRGGALAHITLKRDPFGTPYIAEAYPSTVFVETVPGDKAFLLHPATDTIHGNPTAERQRNDFLIRARKILDFSCSNEK